MELHHASPSKALGHDRLARRRDSEQHGPFDSCEDGDIGRRMAELVTRSGHTGVCPQDTGAIELIGGQTASPRFVIMHMLGMISEGEKQEVRNAWWRLSWSEW